MYENVTFESILKRMLDKALEKDPNIDTREGGIIYSALAPAAVELQNMDIELDTILNETFADTASRDHLIKRCAERGITPTPATKATFKGEFNMDVPIGSRFSLDLLNYAVTEKVQTGVFKLECETAGTAGNEKLGALIPIDYIEGLTKAALSELLIPGEDEEETEALRKRYFDSLDSEAFGGNIADYKEKTNAIDGVGGVKVIPTWNGAGTVKLVIIDSQNKKPSAALVEAVQQAIDPPDSHGMGVGIAPIGHNVTVAGADEVQVNISTHITYKAGWSWADIEASASQVIDGYFSELNSGWADSENLVVRISQIETRLLTVTGVLDIQNTTINGSAANLIVPAYSIPARGVISG
ncbi:MAG: baseplate J/gp47 family protein [Bacillota bacterium]|nr:baseplate J/gp47 family protein [Bacillota bacterium]